MEKIESFKDLGVNFDNKLAFDVHINKKINKVYSVLGIIKRNFIYVDMVSGYIHFLVQSYGETSEHALRRVTLRI